MATSRLTVPEAIAIGVCVTARVLGGGQPYSTPGVEQSTDRLHPARCRYCNTAKDTLLEQLAEFNRLYDVGELERWDNTPKNARWARIREAQEPPWWEQVAQ